MDRCRISTQRSVAQPIDLVQEHMGARERRARTDNHASRWRIDRCHGKRIAVGHSAALTLPDRELADTSRLAPDAPRDMDDLAGFRRRRPEPRDDLGIAATRHAADILAIGLLRDRKPKLTGKLPGHPLAQGGEWKA